MGKIVINNVELELELLDADVMEVYEDTINNVAVKVKDPTAYKGKSNADAMRYQCRCVEEAFDTIFGEGTAAKVFPKNNNLRVRMEAFNVLCNESRNAKEETAALVGKYSPERVENREERRGHNKGGKNNHRYHR